jgi:hypothetical protein
MTETPYITHLSSGAIPSFMNLSSPNFFSVSISFDSRFSFALYRPSSDALGYLVSQSHHFHSSYSTLDFLFFRSHILPWAHYQPPSRPSPLSLRIPKATLKSRPRDARSPLTRSRPTPTGCTRSTEALYHLSTGICRLDSTRFRTIELQVTPADLMVKAGECFI